MTTTTKSRRSNGGAEYRVGRRRCGGAIRVGDGERRFMVPYQGDIWARLKVGMMGMAAGTALPVAMMCSGHTCIQLLHHRLGSIGLDITEVTLETIYGDLAALIERNIALLNAAAEMPGKAAVIARRRRRIALAVAQETTCRHFETALVPWKGVAA